MEVSVIYRKSNTLIDKREIIFWGQVTRFLPSLLAKFRSSARKPNIMRVAHLIITYTSPQQTERMIKRMYHPNFDFYIHVDRKLELKHYQFLGALPNVFFIQNRINVKWADFSTINAIFAGIKEITSNGAQYDFINLLSGQDYPVKSAYYIYNFFLKNAGKEFLSYLDIKNDWKNGLERIENYFLTDWEFQGKYTIETLLNKLLPKRQIPYGLHPYGKSMYWMLHPDTAAFVVDKVENDKEIQQFFSYCWGSHELVFQTVLLNSPLKSKVINNNYRYNDSSSDEEEIELTNENHLQAVRNSSILFINNIDLDKNPKLFDLIDNVLD